MGGNQSGGDEGPASGNVVLKGEQLALVPLPTLGEGGLPVLRLVVDGWVGAVKVHRCRKGASQGLLICLIHQASRTLAAPVTGGNRVGSKGCIELG